MEQKIMIPFHKHLCPSCHTIPHAKEWMESKPSDGIEILHTGKREKPYNHWEPIYIGTNEVDPRHVRVPTWLPEASGLGNLTRSHLPKTISCAQSCIGHECFTQLFQRQSVSETPEAHCIEFHWLALFGWRTLRHPVRNQLTMKDWLRRDDPTRWFRFEKQSDKQTSSQIIWTMR